MADARRSLARGLSERIEAMILAGELKPGQRINESHLATALRVSRAPIREACRRLERHGLVEVRPNLGTFVCTLGDDDIAELYEIRIALEELLGRRAAPRIDELALRELDTCLERLAEHGAAGDSHAYYVANQRFHAVIVAAAGSRHLADAYAGAAKRLAIYRIGQRASAEDMRVSYAEHASIVTALRAHDAVAAGLALAEHCRRGVERHLRRTASAI
jgi:DNA-binding GntR family transcriptional regulator